MFYYKNLRSYGKNKTLDWRIKSSVIKSSVADPNPHQCCGAGPFLTGSDSRYFFFTGSGSSSFSCKNRLKSKKKHVLAFTSLHRLRLQPKSTGSDRSGSATLIRIIIDADPQHWLKVWSLKNLRGAGGAGGRPTVPRHVRRLGAEPVDEVLQLLLSDARIADALNRKRKKNSLQYLKGQCHEIFWHFFISWIKAIWAPDKQAKIVLFKSSFLRRLTLRGVRLRAG